MPLRFVAGAALCTAIGLVHGTAAAQIAPLEQIVVPIDLDSGFVMNTGDTKDEVVFSGVVEVPDAMWLRLTFNQAQLGVDPQTGQEATLRLSSIADGAVQHHTRKTLGQWRDTSAYFNGSAVKVELIADPGVGRSRVVITRVFAGPHLDGGVGTICGPTDDRLPSFDDRAARGVPIGCTTWLIDDTNNCFLTAGHCSGSLLQVIEFNVPESDGGGSINHPGPEDQYAVDVSSKQAVNGGIGNDWGYFGCFANTETGLTAGEAQGASYTLADTPPPVDGQSIRITGYGLDTSPSEWNQIQQTHLGPYFSFSGTTVRYETDTQGGNSGSAVFNEDSGEAIGIHTHGGCDGGGGSNIGTGVNNAGLQNALAAPLGVCLPLPLLEFTFPDGISPLLDPGGDSIRVEVAGANGGTAEPGTGMLHYASDGGVFVSVPMVEESPNVYDAVFPAFDCGTVVWFYFSAETTDMTVVNNPFFAPDDFYSAFAAGSSNIVFTDDFEGDLGWTVSDSPELTAGSWDRGVPLGGGDRGDPPTDGDGSGQCYLTQNVDGDSDVDSGSTTLTSPILDASRGLGVVSYWRWYNNVTGSNPQQDIFVVEVSDDGGTSWTTLEIVGPDGPDVFGGWIQKEFMIDDFVEPNRTFRIRFTASDTDPQSIVEAGVDGVQLLALDCKKGGLPGDVDGDGDVDITDFLLLLSDWGPCPEPCPPSCAADFDDDCNVGITDFLILLANWT